MMTNEQVADLRRGDRLRRFKDGSIWTVLQQSTLLAEPNGHARMNGVRFCRIPAVEIWCKQSGESGTFTTDSLMAHYEIVEPSSEEIALAAEQARAVESKMSAVIERIDNALGARLGDGFVVKAVVRAGNIPPVGMVDVRRADEPGCLARRVGLVLPTYQDPGIDTVLADALSGRVYGDGSPTRWDENESGFPVAEFVEAIAVVVEARLAKGWPRW